MTNRNVAFRDLREKPLLFHLRRLGLQDVVGGRQDVGRFLRVGLPNTSRHGGIDDLDAVRAQLRLEDPPRGFH